MTPGGQLPIYLNSEIGYALWWLNHPERGEMTGIDIINRLVARGIVSDREQARAVLRAARSNIAAHNRIQQASGRTTLRAVCGYRCDPNTPIALRIRLDVVDGSGAVVESRSIVIQARASERLQDVLDRARDTFNRRYRAGTGHRSGQLRIDRGLTPQDVDQVLLNYTEGI